jgi:hypothetical protein
MPSTRSILFVFGFVIFLSVAVAVVAYNTYGALTLTAIPPGRMSVLTYIGLKDLERGTLTAEALKASALLAYALSSFGLRDFTAMKGAALLTLAALPFAGGLFGYVAARSKLVGGATALLLSLIPFTYLSAIGGDYTFVSAVVLVQSSLLFSLLLVSGRRAWLSPVWLILSVVPAALVGLDMVSASWLLFVTALIWAAYSLFAKGWVRSMLVAVPGIISVAASLFVAPPDPTEALRLISPITTLPQYQLLLGILGVAGVAGSVSLFYRMRRDAIPALSVAVAGMALFPYFGVEAFLLVFPGVVVLAMVPLPEVREMISAVKEPGAPGEGLTVLEVHFEKAVAFAFAIMMLSSPLVTGFGPGSAVQGTNYLGNEELSTINQVKTLNPSLFGPGLVAAPSSIAPWLRAELGVNTLLALSPNDSSLADAITSTTFRLRNSYMMVDEWTPLSAVRSPFIYAFDGSIYGAILHLDDGTNRVNLTSPQGGRSEDTGGMYMLGHAFFQNSSAMTLSMRLTKVGFNVTKQISLATSGPALEISYYIVPSFGSPTSMTLPVYIEGAQKITSSTSGDTIRVSMASANLTLAFPGGSAPVLVHGATQDYVQSTFTAKGGVIMAGVSMDLQKAKSSGEGPFYGSLLDTARRDGITSLLTFAPEPGLNFLAVASAVGLTLDTKDAFNRFSYMAANGTRFIESATYAQVLSQSVSNSTCAATISYATRGLDIQKRVNGSGDTVSMTYSVQPRLTGAALHEFNLTIWIPFGRTLLDYGTGTDSLVLRLDSGPVTITPTAGHFASVQVGPDPVYGQFRAIVTFILPSESATVGAAIAFGKQVSCQEILSTRPVQVGTDELQLFTLSGAFLQVFSNNYFTIYQVSPGELPP